MEFWPTWMRARPLYLNRFSISPVPFAAVDGGHQDAFLDIHSIEKERGITVFSDQAVFTLQGRCWFLVDTPGHVDFSGEMERSLKILDYSVLVISCVEGIQSHTETIWKLLEQNHVPVLLFLNKIDRPGRQS